MSEGGKQVTITLANNVWDEIADAVDMYQDSGPEGEQWASEEILQARECLACALSEARGDLE